MKIHVKFPDGTVRDLEGKPNRSVMEVIRDAGLPIRAECGGAMACASCHVVVDDAWLELTGKATDDENDLLQGSDYQVEGSRLSCQIPLTEKLDGLTVALQLDAYEG
jgi:2Fe-2S ferredoxin